MQLAVSSCLRLAELEGRIQVWEEEGEAEGREGREEGGRRSLIDRPSVDCESVLKTKTPHCVVPPSLHVDAAPVSDALSSPLPPPDYLIAAAASASRGDSETVDDSSSNSSSMNSLLPSVYSGWNAFAIDEEAAAAAGNWRGIARASIAVIVINTSSSFSCQLLTRP